MLKVSISGSSSLRTPLTFIRRFAIPASSLPPYITPSLTVFSYSSLSVERPEYATTISLLSIVFSPQQIQTTTASQALTATTSDAGRLTTGTVIAA
jgi:hypothetical protein